jgi:hypothetical protein
MPLSEAKAGIRIFGDTARTVPMVATRDICG